MDAAQPESGHAEPARATAAPVQPTAGTTRARFDTSGIRPERASRLRRPARFVLTYLDLPNDGSDPSLPLGTCLVLRAVGRTVRDVLVDLPGGPVRAREKLRPGAMLGIATPVELGALTEVGTVFVEWADSLGTPRTSWLRLPPVPARYRSRTV